MTTLRKKKNWRRKKDRGGKRESGPGLARQAYLCDVCGVP
jgi:hypothetical protein